MTNKTKFFRALKLYFLISVCLCLSNCRSDKNLKFEYFENEFNQKISESKAKESPYQYDGLVPQNSYFVNSKLKYLKYTHNPENGQIQSFVYFDEITDSLSRIIRRKISYESENWNSKRRKIYSDTIIEILYKQKKIYKYVENKKIETTINQREFEIDLQFIKSIKLAAEKNYNYR